MAKDTISISYGQSSPIAKKSEVYFYNQIPDLQAFFYSVKPANRRFFITDRERKRCYTPFARWRS